MMPKVGDIVKLNPDFLKIWFKRGRTYLGEEVWKEKFKVIEIKDLEYESGIFFEYKDHKYNLYILPNGELNLLSFTEEFKGIKVFISVN